MRFSDLFQWFLAGTVILGVAPVYARQSRPSGVPVVQNAATVTFDYPADKSLFPPDFAAPTFLWRDAAQGASRWLIDVAFGDGSPGIRVNSKGEPPPLGEIDERCAKAGAVAPAVPGGGALHSWKPDAEAWAAIKAHTVKRPATITIAGFTGSGAGPAVSAGSITIQTSKDPVGAPIFYRDVPLISVPVGERGVIMPLPSDAVPFIAWRLKYVNEGRSRLMMEGLPTCANCHSFSRDGKTLGLDVDGPQNDKGLYGLIPVKRETSIRDEYVIRWSKFSEEKASKRFGFMSQVSPDGQFVVTSIENPGSHIRGLDNRLYNGFYKDYGFGQVFFPTRGVLAWYSRETGTLRTLPGADDPKYVQSSAFWSPDGKYLIYSRAEAKDPYYQGQRQAEYANDPNETQIQYDLYRIPFNKGKGGTPEPLKGASQNGMSNNFPKVSPDGKWIVYVQCRNGLLMRPDSRLYIVAAKGGTPRALTSNTPRMNSWHSFSPNGRWLVFSSKGRSLYTQMFLTHIDKKGNDSPAILIEDATAANRAVNIPEFLNVPPDGLAKMEAPATEFYRLCTLASDLAGKGQFGDAIPEWLKALKLEPEDSKAHYGLAVCLQNQGKPEEAIVHYEKALAIAPETVGAQTNIGVALAGMGKLDEAIARYRKALEIDPVNANAHGNLGAALLEKGSLDEAVFHCRKALESDTESAEVQNTLGIALARSGQMNESVWHLEKAVAVNGESLEYRYNLGRVLAAKHEFEKAVPQLEKAVSLSGGREPMILELLAAMYSETGRFAEAARTAQKALDIATGANDYSLMQMLRARVAQYESHVAKP